MINYLLRETKSQERLRLGKLFIAGDMVNFNQLAEYHKYRDDYIKSLKSGYPRKSRSVILY